MERSIPVPVPHHGLSRHRTRSGHHECVTAKRSGLFNCPRDESTRRPVSSLLGSIFRQNVEMRRMHDVRVRATRLGKRGDIAPGVKAGSVVDVFTVVDQVFHVGCVSVACVIVLIRGRVQKIQNSSCRERGLGTQRFKRF